MTYCYRFPSDALYVEEVPEGVSLDGTTITTEAVTQATGDDSIVQDAPVIRERVRSKCDSTYA